MSTVREHARSTFFLLLASGVVLGGIAAVLFYVGAQEENVVPTLIASAASLGTVLLLGFAVKSLYSWLAS